MKKPTIYFLLAVLPFVVFSQNKEFVYTNAEYGIEVTFPFEPKVDVNNSEILNAIIASSDLLNSYGLGYTLSIAKVQVKLYGINFAPKSSVSELAKFYEKKLDSKMINKSIYKAGKIEVIEMERSDSTYFWRDKAFYFNDVCFTLSVFSESKLKEKDVLPFFNSLKLNGKSIQNPTADNSLFKEYALEKLANVKSDTLTQVIYVKTGSKNSYQYMKLSDVDKNIPQNASSNSFQFALIVGNEDYCSRQTDLKSESNVEFARNDASGFKEYCTNTLGIPEKNITFLLDATVGQINQGISKLKLLAKVSGGKAQLIVFYAGHGLPDETTKEPYLIPVDVSGANVTSGIKLQDLYSNLTEFPSERVTVYLDACFTGGGRSAGLIASRGVKVRPKEGVLKGNIVVFSSSSGEQSSLPYADQKHGMFTYFLLKKLQETKGDVTYSDLSTFLQEKISVESILVNSKEQNPVVNTSQEVLGAWKLWKMK